MLNIKKIILILLLVLFIFGCKPTVIDEPVEKISSKNIQLDNFNETIPINNSFKKIINETELPYKFGVPSSVKVKFYGDVNQTEIIIVLNSIPDYYFQNLNYLYFYECNPSQYYGYHKNNKIWINLCRLEKHNRTLREALAHELGRLYWNTQYSYDERKEWCDFVNLYGTKCSDSYAEGFII